MKISDLPIGAMIYFGSEKRRDGVIDMVWVKVNGQNGFCTNGSAAYCFMDAIEPQSESRDRRTHGSNFFPQTNIAQWLNASGNNWYTPQHEDDGSKSVFIIQQFMQLKVEEAVAINCHMASWDGNTNVGGAFESFPLAWILHVADEAASFLIETRGEDNKE